MGNCASRDDVNIPPPPVSSALLQPMPQPCKAKTLIFDSPVAGRRESGAMPKKEHYSLDTLEPDLTTLTPISSSLFLCMIQRKSRRPMDYILLDVQPRQDHIRNSIKFSICLWETNALADCANAKMRSDILNTIKAKCNDKIILISDVSETPSTSRNVSAFIELLQEANITHKSVLLLNTSMAIFCKRYPHCFAKSQLSVPGPTELLWAPSPAFCLYLGDVRSLKFNEQVLTDVHDIRFVVNLAGQQAVNLTKNPSVEIITVPQSGCPSRGAWYARAVETLLEVSSRGLPLMVMDATGDKHAPAICAFFLVSMGWTASESMNHISLRRGCTRDAPLFDTDTAKALQKLAQKDKDGAIAAYPQWRDDSLSHPL